MQRFVARVAFLRLCRSFATIMARAPCAGGASVASRPFATLCCICFGAGVVDTFSHSRQFARGLEI